MPNVASNQSVYADSRPLLGKWDARLALGSACHGVDEILTVSRSVFIRSLRCDPATWSRLLLCHPVGDPGKALTCIDDRSQDTWKKIPPMRWTVPSAASGRIFSGIMHPDIHASGALSHSHHWSMRKSRSSIRNTQQM